MSEKRYKIEIIDNQIGDYFQMNLFVWGRKNWWSKEDWNVEFRHIIGKKYMCPEIYKGRTTAERMFEEEVKMELEREGIEEIHRIQILPHIK
jgi:hypothetical protein